MLGCDSYFLMISSISPEQMLPCIGLINGSISKLSTASMKKLFNFSATSPLSVITILFSTMVILRCIPIGLSENNGLTLCQKVLLSLNMWRSKLL